MKLDYTQIGKRIAARRKNLGLKQRQVSEIADIITSEKQSRKKMQKVVK